MIARHRFKTAHFLRSANNSPEESARHQPEAPWRRARPHSHPISTRHRVTTGSRLVYSSARRQADRILTEAQPFLDPEATQKRLAGKERYRELRRTAAL